MPALSVVVPVYNVEDYLEWCLESLSIQSFEDIEILCVNDGSTDGSLEILERCRENDARIKVISKPNGGLSSARNAGICAATSPYVCFLDSDDRFTHDACEVIVNAFLRTDADVITFGANCYPDSGGNAWLEQHLSPRDAVYAPFQKDLLFKEMSRPFAWRTACRTSFLRDNNLFFNEEMKFGEDQVFHFAIYPRSSKTVLVSNKLYDYRVTREGSLMATVASDLYRKGMEHIPIAEAILSDWKNMGLLSTYSREMLEWVVDFNAYEALSLPVEKASNVLDAVGSLVMGYWGEEDIKAACLPRHVDRVLRLCLSGGTRSGSSLKESKILYRASEDGLGGLFHSALGFLRRSR